MASMIYIGTTIWYECPILMELQNTSGGNLINISKWNTPPQSCVELNPKSFKRRELK